MGDNIDRDILVIIQKTIRKPVKVVKKRMVTSQRLKVWRLSSSHIQAPCSMLRHSIYADVRMELRRGRR